MLPAHIVNIHTWTRSVSSWGQALAFFHGSEALRILDTGQLISVTHIDSGLFPHYDFLWEIFHIYKTYKMFMRSRIRKISLLNLGTVENRI